MHACAPWLKIPVMRCHRCYSAEDLKTIATISCALVARCHSMFFVFSANTSSFCDRCQCEVPVQRERYVYINVFRHCCYRRECAHKRLCSRPPHQCPELSRHPGGYQQLNCLRNIHSRKLIRCQAHVSRYLYPCMLYGAALRARSGLPASIRVPVPCLNP